MYGRTSLENLSRQSEIELANFNSAELWRDIGQLPRASPPQDKSTPSFLEMTNPFIADSAPSKIAVPLQFEEQARSAKSLALTDSMENESNGTQPDYKLVKGSDGRFTLMKIGEGDQLKHTDGPHIGKITDDSLGAWWKDQAKHIDARKKQQFR